MPDYVGVGSPNASIHCSLEVKVVCVLRGVTEVVIPPLAHRPFSRLMSRVVDQGEPK